MVSHASTDWFWPTRLCIFLLQKVRRNVFLPAPDACLGAGLLRFVSDAWVDREAFAKGFDFGPDLGFDLCVAVFAIGCEAVDHLDDPVGD
ncbi:hypothetical protein SAMN06295998_12745, partial [Primorskyibacter flagellatus]